MTLFVYEHLTSGALAAEPLSAELVDEGEAMLQAVVADLVALGHTICLMRDMRLPAMTQANHQTRIIPINNGADYQKAWRDALMQFDDFLVIAPETDNTLLQLISMLADAGKRYYGCEPQAVRLCSDKNLCCQTLQQAGILTPDSFIADTWLAISASEQDDWVVKPIDGAGCESTFRFNTQQTREHLLTLPANLGQTTLVQPYIRGKACSVSLFIDETGCQVLSINDQHMLESGHQMHLQQSEPGYSLGEQEAALAPLLRQIHATIPGLWGFVGIDMIYTQHALWVIEINPRLTSAYAQAAFRLRRNPALSLHQHLLT